MTRGSRIAALIVCGGLLLAIIGLSGCDSGSAATLTDSSASTTASNPPDEGFAVYLPATEIPLSQLSILEHVEIPDTALFYEADIVSYSEDTHEIELTAEASNRIAELEVPVSGRAFVVCVDRRPVYTGALCTPISSMSFDGVVILKRLDSEVTAQDRHVIQLQLGYPNARFFSGEDPRADPAILEAMERAGKLLHSSDAPLSLAERQQRFERAHELASTYLTGVRLFMPPSVEECSKDSSLIVYGKVT